MIRALTFGTMVFLVCSGVAAQGAVSSNAAWNESSSGGIGFWIYPIFGDCQDLREKALPLVFSPKIDKDMLAVSDLKYCYQLPDHSRGQIIRCQSGHVHLTRDSKARRYTGKYEFMMSDGSKREGAFVAQFCRGGSG